MFDRHKKEHLFQKKKLSVLIRRLCIWLYFLSFKKCILLDFKQNTLFANISTLCYAIYKLINDKSDATSQLGYIPSACLVKFAKVTYITINKRNIYHDYIFISNFSIYN